MQFYRYSNLILLFALMSVQTLNAQSVLSSGNWYKLGITQTGIHKLDYNSLVSLGIDPNNIDPRKIKIYGNGGGMLPQLNNAPKADDLQENAILVAGQDDGKFDTADYILFYAQNADKWNYNATNQTFVHEKNLYSDKNFYFITIGSTDGLRITDQASEANATQTISVFDDYLFYEKDEVNILHKDKASGSGREWYGEFFGFETQRSFSFALDGITGGSNILLTSAVLGQSYTKTNFTVQVNGVGIGEQSMNAITDATYAYKGADAVNTFTLNSNNIPQLPTFNIAYTYNKSSSSDKAYLNYIRIQYQRNLKLYGNQTTFRAIASLGQAVSNFNIQDANGNFKIWDITNPLIPKNQVYGLSGNQAVFGANTTSLKEFVVWQGSDFTKPEFLGSVPNQDLHSLSVSNLVIVTPQLFLEQAQKLAEFRRTHDGLSVSVVLLEQIYNEFSSGKQDISAIRNFMKMLYDKNPATLKYLLLLGDASFDYKDRTNNNTNLVPIYESRESLHPIYSYSSDDYFGFLEDNEGEWTETTSTSPIYDHTLEIGVGRLPVKTVEEAAAVVNKLIYYGSNSNTFGKWRNQVTFVADDGDVNQHQKDADNISNVVENTYPKINVKKILLDAYPQESTPSGETATIAKQLLDNAVEKGTLILNYTGHGGEVGWAEEYLLRTSQIKEWSNINHLPLFITATCEFGRYDEPLVVSGAEAAILNPKGGAISLITTTRPVFSSSNFLLNKQVYDVIFQPVDGEMPRLGDIIKYTKNNSLSGSINRNFSLLGDPSLRLAYPKENIVITKINDKDITIEQDSIKALQKITIEGEIRNGLGNKLDNFSGLLEVSVYDKISQKTTYGTDNSPKMAFNVRETLLFQGQVSVKEGNFKFSFIPPKDINYTFGTGKISLYASNTEKTLDANGGNLDIIVGGSANEIATDNTPPDVSLYLNDLTFKNGGLVNEHPTLLAYLADENGINISDVGIAHSITTFLNDSTDNVKILNEYYIADLDTYQSGQLAYPFRELPAGRHKLTFKAWDVYNNSTEKVLEFVVANSTTLAIKEVFNYPNPLFDYTNFQIEHNRLGDDLEVFIDIYDGNGQFITTLTSVFKDSPTRLDSIQWEGVNATNAKLGNGIYLYKVTVHSLTDSSKASVINRLVIVK